MFVRSATDSRLIPDINFNVMSDVETGSSLLKGGIHSTADWIGGLPSSAWPLNYGRKKSKKSRKGKKKAKKSRKSKKKH